MPDKVIDALCYLLQTFDEYAAVEGDANTLTRSELKELISKEFAHILGNVDDKAELDRIFKEMDVNKDNTVDFREFMDTVSRVGAQFYDIIKDLK